jgi:hypothetical protein
MVAPGQCGELQGFARHAVKLLDLLTNRYHVGVLEAAWDEGVRVVLPATAHLRAGQRVRFVVADGEPLVSKGSMKRALVSDVDVMEGGLSDQMSVELSVVPELGLA